MRGHPVIRGHFLRTVSYLPHVKEPVMKGHLSCRDTFSGILRCPLKKGFTVYVPLAVVSPDNSSQRLKIQRWTFNRIWSNQAMRGKYDKVRVNKTK